MILDRNRGNNSFWPRENRPLKNKQFEDVSQNGELLHVETTVLLSLFCSVLFCTHDILFDSFFKVTSYKLPSHVHIVTFLFLNRDIMCIDLLIHAKTNNLPQKPQFQFVTFNTSSKKLVLLLKLAFYRSFDLFLFNLLVSSPLEKYFINIPSFSTLQKVSP